MKQHRHTPSSTQKTRNRRNAPQREYDFYDQEEEDDDDFYKVVIPSGVTQWRTQAKLAVAPASDNAWSRQAGCRFGLYQRGSHVVLPIPDCAVHHPSINRAIQILQECTAQAGTAAFSESSREGGLRYVQCQVERTTGKVILTLVWHADQLKDAQPALGRLVKALQTYDKKESLWHSIWCHCNDSAGNVIFHRNPRRWHRLVGPEYCREPLPRMSSSKAGNHNEEGSPAGWLYFSPMTFRQGNLDGFSVLALDVAQAVPPGSKVCELYAGVGVLGLTALAHHHYGPEALKWIRCSDENPHNPRCFNRAVDSLPSYVTGQGNKNNDNNKDRRRRSSGPKNEPSSSASEGLTLAQLAKLLEEGQDPFADSSGRNNANNDDGDEPKTSYMVASAAQALRAGQALGANVLIVDPPRKGLEDAVLDELCKPFTPNQPYVDSASLLSIPDDKIHWTNDVRTLIYVSCGFEALARDAERLLTSRAGWKIQSATGYILFPGSDHVETLAIFER